MLAFRSARSATLAVPAPVANVGSETLARVTPEAATRATPAIGASPVAFQTSNKVGLARLNELTELYKADKITPYEYHHERAKIVASL